MSVEAREETSQMSALFEWFPTDEQKKMIGDKFTLSEVCKT